MEGEKVFFKVWPWLVDHALLDVPTHEYISNIKWSWWFIEKEKDMKLKGYINCRSWIWAELGRELRGEYVQNTLHASIKFLKHKSIMLEHSVHPKGCINSYLQFNYWKSIHHHELSSGC